MKVRESLTDEGEKGTIMTIPDGISVYPNNSLFFVFGTISLVMFAVGFVLLCMYYKDRLDI